MTPIQTYRVRKSMARTAYACSMFAIAAWCGSLVLVILDPHDEFGQPLRFATLFSLFWGAFLLLGGFLIVEARNHKLRLRKVDIELVTAWSRRQIEIDEIVVSSWRVAPQGGCLRIISQTTATNIYFGNYEPDHRMEIITNLRALIPKDRQQNWSPFDNYLHPPPSRKRFTAQFRAAVFALFGFTMLGCWYLDLGGVSQFHFAVAIANLIVAGWILMDVRRPAALE